MCGIIGYTTNKNNAVEVAIEGLKNLEYRGYDSSGVAFFGNDKLNICKASGKILNLDEKLKTVDTNSVTAIAHTRWATHGEPNESNAHPHKVKNVTLVHNGIIENYAALKEDLLGKGFSFASDTDTEVASALVAYEYEKTNDKIQSLINATKIIRGSYAFNVIFDDELETIYATRKDSPLIIGYSEEGNFAASDISAILDFTTTYSLLEEGEFAIVKKDEVKVFDEDKNILEKEVLEATWSATQYQKNGYDHFMLKEIHEQPKVISDLYNRFINNCEYDDINFNDFDAIHIVACGSAMHAGLVGKHLLQNYAKVRVTVDIASEYRYTEQLITPSTLVIIISQSGETADSLAALRIAKEHGAKTIGIINAVGSTISREVDTCIYTYAGPEIAVATTKGYTSQVAILSTLAINAMKQKGLLNDTEKAAIEAELLQIESTLSSVIANIEDYKDIADHIYEHEDLFFIGRGLDNAICMEGSLKLKEISYMHSESYPAGELKHGTISLVEDDTPIISISTNARLHEKTVSNIKETKARGAYSILITTDDYKSEDLTDFSDKVVYIPKTNDLIQAIPVVIALQLIAYETSKLRDCDIDKPRNLAKSVTVE